MAARRQMLAGLIPVGFQKITLANSTALGLNSTVRIGAHVFDVSVETNDARYRFDSTAASLTTGVLLPAANVYRWEGVSPSQIANLTFQRSTGTCVLNIQSYKSE